MIICLDGFEKIRENHATQVWNKKEHYVITDKRMNALCTVNLNTVSKADLIGILLNEYKDDKENTNRLKRVVGDPVARKAYGEA